MSIIFLLEATTRFELVMEILQTSALPLGDVAIYYNKWCPEAESNHRHGDFQSPALPTELSGQGWWALRDSNPGPAGYEPDALTN